MEKNPDIDALLAALGAEREAAQPAASEFGERLGRALEEALGHLRQEGLVEVTDANLPALQAEVIAAGLDARSPKQLMKRVVHALIESDHVEEVFGTDEMLFDGLRAFLDPQ